MKNKTNKIINHKKNLIVNRGVYKCPYCHTESNTPLNGHNCIYKPTSRRDRIERKFALADEHGW